MGTKQSRDFEQLHADVISVDLCTRCGICAGVCPVQVIGFNDSGLPLLTGKCIACNKCNACCPGAYVGIDELSQRVYKQTHADKQLEGLVEQRYVAHAKNENVRNKGSSGGMVTAILIHLLKAGLIDGALVTTWDKDDPLRLTGFLAKTVEEIQRASGSKYMLVPSMQTLKELRNLPGKYAIVALPCQVHGLRKMEQASPELSSKIYCILGLFCHNNNGLKTVRACLDAKRIDHSHVKRFEFRGADWPGKVTVGYHDGKKDTVFPVSQGTIINLLFKLYGAKRCFMCQDPLAFLADLSFGDFWASDYKGELAEMKSCSFVYQRTDTGRRVIEEVGISGTVNLVPLNAHQTPKRNLNMARGKINSAAKYLDFRRSKGLAVPDSIIGSEKNHFKSSFGLKYVLFKLLRKRIVKRAILRMYASWIGIAMDLLTRSAKKILLRNKNR